MTTSATGSPGEAAGAGLIEARAEADDIVLLSDEDEPRLRWRFTDIRPDSFTWIGESSSDGGATWNRDEEMHATRITSAGPG